MDDNLHGCVYAQKMSAHLYVCMCMCASAHVCTDVCMYVCMYVCMHVCMQVSITTSNYSKMRNLIRRSRNLRNIWFGLVLANGQNACDDGPIKKGALQCTAQDPPAGTSRQSETSKPQAACLKKPGEAVVKKSKAKKRIKKRIKTYKKRINNV